ncbi:MAG: bifunctional precorrin-2 dehydrogenase/sirohydrochlorin ferrochelatase [Candidatus Methylomirabilales bacterium]
MRKFYPMMVDLTGKRCLVVGGGAVAERKVALLVECSAGVEVVSPKATARLLALASSGRIRLRRRPVRASDLPGAFLVVVATDDAQVNREVAGRVKSAGGLVNVVDDPAACSFLVPSVVRRGDLTVAISTAGGSPALAKKLRQRLEQTIGPEYEAFVAALRLLRERTRQAIADPQDRQAIYRRAVESDLFEAAARGDSAAVAARIEDFVTLPPQTGARIGRAG